MSQETKEVYKVAFEHLERLTYDEWLVIERGQISELGKKVTSVLIAAVAELQPDISGAETPADTTTAVASATITPSGVAVLSENLYRTLATKAGFEQSPPDAATAPTAKSRGGKTMAGEDWVKKSKEKKSGKVSAASIAIRAANTGETLTGLAADIAAACVMAERAYSRRGAEPEAAYAAAVAAVAPWLRNEIFEVRALVLLALSRLLLRNGSFEQVNELDVAIQRFLAPITGRSYDNPTAVSPPAACMVADLTRALGLLRARHPFDGVRIAIAAPKIVWTTRYDDCLVAAPVSLRENQRATIAAIHRLRQTPGTFLLMNRAPPGAGKSALITPIAHMLDGNRKMDKEVRKLQKERRMINRGIDVVQEAKEELYVCAGQGPGGVVQFAQALYGARVPFALVFCEDGKLEIVKQQSFGNIEARVFVGTADAITLLASGHSRKGWVIIDEPTFGADVAGSRPCLELMRLLARLPRENRRVIMFGATLPHPTQIPSIARLFERIEIVDGGLDSVQIACDVCTTDGCELYPHTGCHDKASLTAVVDRLVRSPFLARMYSVEACSRLNTRITQASGTGVDLDTVFATAHSLRPASVTAAAARLLTSLADEPDDVIRRVCEPGPARAAPFDAGSIVTTAPPTHQTMIVDTEPLKYALTHFAPLLEELRSERVNVKALYSAYATKKKDARSRLEALGTKKKESRSGQSEGKLRTDDEQLELSDIKLGFPCWAQIGTAPHRARFKASTADARAPLTPETVAGCEVAEEVQALLLCGVGILSREAVKDKKYNSEVWRLLSEGQLLIVVTDHTGCYGANLMLGTVIITESFANVASTATLEQAGGRLCRVGLSYRGVLILPPVAAAKMFAEIRDATASRVEAQNMEAAFRAARA